MNFCAKCLLQIFDKAYLLCRPFVEAAGQHNVFDLQVGAVTFQGQHRYGCLAYHLPGYGICYQFMKAIQTMGARNHQLNPFSFYAMQDLVSKVPGPDYRNNRCPGFFYPVG